MPKKGKRANDEEEEEQYHVEVITKARVNSDGEWDYYVKWAGYGSEADSWEPSENVKGCERLLKSFWTRGVGMDDKDYEEGEVVEASPKWIEEEKEFFNAHFGRPEEVAKKKKRRRSRTPKPVVGKAITKKNARGKTTLKKPQIQDSDSDYQESESEDDIPIITSKLKAGKRGRQDGSGGASSDSEGSDIPLRKAPRRSSLSKPRMAKQDVASAAKSSKGKETARPRRATFDHDPLFSEPSSPETRTSRKKLSESASVASTSKAAAPLQKTATTVNSHTAPAPPKQPAPSHKNREPKVKLMSLPMDSVAANFTDTKRRLAEQTGQVPKPVPQQEADPEPARKDPLKSLSFRKTKSAADVAKQPSSVTPQAGPSQDPRRPTATSSFFPDRQVVDSPVVEAGGAWGSGTTWGRAQSPAAGGWGTVAISGTSSWGITQQVPHASPTAPTPPVERPPDPRKVAMARRQSTPQEQQKKAAEEFLASIMPAQLAAPMHEPTGNEMDVDPLPAAVPIIRKPVIPQTRIPKKFQWDGELRMRHASDLSTPAAKLCGISLSEASDPRPGGARLNLCYTAEIPYITLEKLHEITDVYLLLRACAPIQQYCKVSAQGADDEDIFKTFATYLGRRRQFTYARAYMDDTQIGILLFVPTVAYDICKILKVPLQLREHPLVAILIPWKLTVAQYQSYEWQAAHERLGLSDVAIAPEVVDKDPKLRNKLIANPRLAQGLRLHQFTAADQDFFVRAARRYCIWNKPSDGNPQDGLETRLLQVVLENWKAQRTGYKEDVRVVFVHVGSLYTLHKLEALALRRCKRPELRFYTYGTHATIPPNRWGVREIYPVGGIATFSAKAIIEDPFRVCELIEQLDQHPLWACYVHPLVLAAVAKISYPSSDAVSLVTRDNFFYIPILDLIIEGKVAVLEAPPKSRQPRMAPNDTSRIIDPAVQWAEWSIQHCSLDAAGVLENCLQYFEERYRELPQKDLVPVADRVLVDDLLQMQLQPAIMEDYRRFVMVTETRNEQPVEHGVEFIPISQDFDFRDDYYNRY